MSCYCDLSQSLQSLLHHCFHPVVDTQRCLVIITFYRPKSLLSNFHTSRASLKLSLSQQGLRWEPNFIAQSPHFLRLGWRLIRMTSNITEATEAIRWATLLKATLASCWLPWLFDFPGRGAGPIVHFQNRACYGRETSARRQRPEWYTSSKFKVE